ncbi:inositol polyphosphate 5-phosphatase ocrl-1 [Teratosphaeria destructans]|uniref:Inositol polyphosphate 5-phosphatase ocrl-1 n=1 Tax=Teratosphaeria destructans TaxID=418781 RepID=A0A9W7SSK8_9PEZI|nr:inositol polyphosphate 5-phosphatase ocrl-1 [Teratosphaeria destructans]
MTSTRSRAPSKASQGSSTTTTTTATTTSSLMQDVPGAFPAPSATGSSTDGGGREQEAAFHSLSQAIYARRSDYVRPKHVRIKVGSWNVAAYKGTEKDVGGWFVGGKGVADGLGGRSRRDQEGGAGPSRAKDDGREDAAAQEARYQKKQSTVPRGEPGALPGEGDVGLYVLGLQEVVDVNSFTEALRPYTDPSVASKWKDALIYALPWGYTLVAEQQLIGMLLLIYAAPDVATDVKSVSTTSVGTGIAGYMGNKGAVTARIVLGETTRLVFVNCHMSAGADKAALERRNRDAAQIITRTRFEPIRDAMDLNQTSGEQIGDEDFAFWCGDLNYRLEGIPGDDVRRLLMLHTRNEYDLSQQSAEKIERELAGATESVKRRAEDRQSTDSTNSPASSANPSDNRSSIGNTSADSAATTLVDEVVASEDPTSLQTTLSSLLPHDELHQQMRTRKAFHDGWREGPITFLPTYKYDAGSVGVFDSSEKKRAPSWCDRILYRTRRDRLAYYAKVHAEEAARKRDEEMTASGLDDANDEEMLYDYDPETDGADIDEYDEYDENDGTEDGVVITKEGFEDEIQLEYYTAHQRILSSDHKPLDAVFILKYDAVVPELKAKVHAEVVKELDKAENEGRPNITVVVDKHRPGDTEHTDRDPAHFTGVWFGPVRWGQAKHRTLTIANTGRVPASFNFIERPVGATQSEGIAPKWINLKVSHQAFASSSKNTETLHLDPGEACVVELEIRIFDVRIAHDLNDGLQELDDILVLRVDNGRDHFIPVRAEWQATSLGHSIDKLVRIPEGGIRKLQRQKPDSSSSHLSRSPRASGGSKDSSNSSHRNSGASDLAHASVLGLPQSKSPAPITDDMPVRFSAPRELFKLTEVVEVLVGEVMAEFDMIRPDSRLSSESMQSDRAHDDFVTPPWDRFPDWPFGSAAWLEKDTESFKEATASVLEALDSDAPLDPSSLFPPETPRLQRLYIVSSLLILFLSSIPDGIINPPLWTHIESFLAENEKKKKKKGGCLDEDDRTAIQEILAREPARNISFILITGMVQRVISAVSEPQQHGYDGDGAPAPPPSPGKRGGAFVGKWTALGRPSVPSPAHAPSMGGISEAERVVALGKLFADLLVRVEGSGGRSVGEKQRGKRGAWVVEGFLTGL